MRTRRCLLMEPKCQVDDGTEEAAWLASHRKALRFRLLEEGRGKWRSPGPLAPVRRHA